MLTGPDDTNWHDRACAVFGILAGVHCLLAGAAGSRMGWFSGEGAHLLFAVLAAGPSLVATVRGWFVHASSRVLGYAVPAWLALAAARFGWRGGMDETSEIALTVLASLLLVVAHQLNRSLGYWHKRD